MDTGGAGPDVTVRAFTWDDLPALYDVMSRAGGPPFAYADDPPAALAQSLRAPRLNATADIFVADSGERLEGWVRVDLEPGIRRAVADCGVDADIAEIAIRPRLLRMAVDRAREAGAGVFHVPVAQGDDLKRMAAAAIGMEKARTYQWMEYNPAPAYLKGDHRPLPDGFRVRPMDGIREAAVLTNLQNTAFDGMWGYAPNNVEDVESTLGLPGLGPEWVLFVEDASSRVAGYVWTRFEPTRGMSTGYVGMVGVHPDFRGKGLGAAVTAAGIRLLRDAGAGVIKLEVDRENKPARRIYLDLGFRPISDTTWYELAIQDG